MDRRSRTRVLGGQTAETVPNTRGSDTDTLHSRGRVTLILGTPS